MKLKNVKDIQDFMAVCDSCAEDVILTSIYGDRYNLKSTLSQYVAVAALVGEHGEELELWCRSYADEQKFYEFFRTHEGVVNRPDMVKIGVMTDDHGV